MAKVRAYGPTRRCRLAARRPTEQPRSAAIARSTSSRALCRPSSPLGDDPLLGRGRNAQDPYRGLITDEGRIEIPLDLRGTGFWLTGLFGTPATTQSKASGRIAFSAQAGREQHDYLERRRVGFRDGNALRQPDTDRR